MKPLEKTGLIVAFALCLVGVARAQSGTRDTPCNAATPNDAVCISWTAPAKYTDGKAIGQSLTYRVEQRSGFSGTWTTITASQTDTKRYVEDLAPGTYFFRVYANCATNCAESAASNTASKATTAPVQTPEAPVITIAVVIGMDHAPVYKVTQAGKRDERYSDACGFIEVGRACDGPVLFIFRGSKFRHVKDTDVKAWKVSCAGSVAAPCA